MVSMKIVSRLLRFKDFRAVSLWFEGRGAKEILVIAVKPHKTGCLCPECGRRGKVVHTLKPRRWHDSRAYGRSVMLHYSPREIRCPTHGRHVEQIPWRPPRPRSAVASSICSCASASGCRRTSRHACSASPPRPCPTGCIASSSASGRDTRRAD